MFTYCEDVRPGTIARTEIHAAANEGQIEVMKDAGVKYKTWITARDEKVRGSHQIDGQTVKVGEDFVTRSGTRLQYPGDRRNGAPPEETINCRCESVASRTKEGD